MGFHGDVTLCAHAIYCDLAGIPTKLNFAQLRELCARHSHSILPDPCLPASEGAYWDGQNIVISMRMPAMQCRIAIAHELVHALSQTPRWTYLNYMIRGERYNREQFLEAVAQLVALMFV